MTAAVAIALAGALCMALGSALQERDAVGAPGRGVARAGFLLHLLRRPRWLLGTVVVGCGVALHLVALSGAPLTVVQPVGVTGLLFAIVLAGLFGRRPIPAGQVLAGVAVMVGLAGLLFLFPHAVARPVMGVGTGAALVGVALAVAFLAHGLAHRLAAGPRAMLLAAAGGAALGTTSALARVVAAGAAAEPLTVLSPLTLFALVAALAGGLLQQNAYRTGHFAAAYATLLVADPLVGAGIGVLLLGEQLPVGAPDRLLATVAGLLAVAGIAVLARAKYRAPDAGRNGDRATTSVTTTPGDTT
ncbi:DMT family transporter [Marinactinospora thermotolerans]|uniref:Magnesium transporter NIPA n=1 Tax=Marinactinospora thermotolerans DSM 45154 TaxID=1122192 RepID=A0A1T4RN84_9ACTN|nr:DMT family transporter [Marinactinospora thermotolerans]SKA17460.1 hypothetical protein SAMN02745673_02829 [Marinactinospora thermotolerans DSM 45154]